MMNFNIAKVIGFGIDEWGGAYKGGLITNTMIQQGLADDELRAAYIDHQPAIDAWAEHINFAKIGEAVGSGGGGTSGASSHQRTFGALMLGVAIGYGAVLFQQRNKGKGGKK